jgi:hypothetical protein
VPRHRVRVSLASVTAVSEAESAAAVGADVVAVAGGMAARTPATDS